MIEELDNWIEKKDMCFHSETFVKNQLPIYV